MAAIRKALIYPCAIIVIAVGVVWVILVWVIPVFASLFSSLAGGSLLPLPTRITIAASNFLGSFWWLIFGGGALGFYAVEHRSMSRRFEELSARTEQLDHAVNLLRQEATSQYEGKGFIALLDHLS